MEYRSQMVGRLFDENIFLFLNKKFFVQTFFIPYTTMLSGYYSFVQPQEFVTPRNIGPRPTFKYTDRHISTS